MGNPFKGLKRVHVSKDGSISMDEFKKSFPDVCKAIQVETIDTMRDNLIRNSRTESIDGKIKLIVAEDRINFIAEEMKK